MTIPYLPLEQTPTRTEVDRLPGLVLLEFGTSGCGICRALAPHVADATARHPHVRHLKVEDGPGRELGRSFGVKLWPNLIFLKDGVVLRQLVRPTAAELQQVFAEIAETK